MGTYIYEFLYRGRAPGSAEPASWHVQQGQDGVDAFGQALPNGPVMSMAQAEAAGIDLPDILAAINAGSMTLAEEQSAENSRLREQAEMLSETIAGLQEQVTTLTDLLNQSVNAGASLAAEKAALIAENTTLVAEKQVLAERVEQLNNDKTALMAQLTAHLTAEVDAPESEALDDAS